MYSRPAPFLYKDCLLSSHVCSGREIAILGPKRTILRDTPCTNQSINGIVWGYLSFSFKTELQSSEKEIKKGIAKRKRQELKSPTLRTHEINKRKGSKESLKKMIMITNTIGTIFF
jgi:hypothetical protein